MSISWFNSIIPRFFYQQPLPSINAVEDQESVKTKEIVYQWNVNDCVVFLIKKQNTLGEDVLEYKTIKNKKEIYADSIEILENEDIEKKISHLKTCKAMIDENGIVGFLKTYHTWANANRESIWEISEPFSLEDRFINSFADYHKWEYDPTIEISLTRGREGLVWNVFQRITKESSFLYFQESTIPSLQCHPKTIALIEKIKKETLSNPQLLLRFMQEFKVDVISSKDYLKRHEELNNWFWFHMIVIDWLRNVPTNAALALAGSVGVARITYGIISSTTRCVNSFFTGGILRTLATGSVGLTAVAFSSITAMAVLPIRPIGFFRKNCNSLNKRIKLLFPQIKNSLLIEVEPISAPSRIDKRMRVSKFTWAVTLVTHKGSEGNHAKIIVEGLNDGFYNNENPRIKNENNVKIGEKFTYMAEFNPPIRSQIFLPDKDLRYETRTEIWMITSDKVKKMIDSIEEESSLPEEQQLFNYLGIRSKFYMFDPSEWDFSGTVGDNCFTWARRKLKILNIDLKENFVDHLAARVKNYTRNKSEYGMLPVQQLI